MTASHGRNEAGAGPSIGSGVGGVLSCRPGAAWYPSISLASWRPSTSSPADLVSATIPVNFAPAPVASAVATATLPVAATDTSLASSRADLTFMRTDNVVARDSPSELVSAAIPENFAPALVASAAATAFVPVTATNASLVSSHVDPSMRIDNHVAKSAPRVTAPSAIPDFASSPLIAPHMPIGPGKTTTLSKTMAAAEAKVTSVSRTSQPDTACIELSDSDDPEPNLKKPRFCNEAPAAVPPTTPSPARNQNSQSSHGPPDEPPLSQKQEALLQIVLVDKQSVFFTGAAGTGKSRTLREMIRRAPEATTFVTALTGIAATQLLKGTTLHSFAGIGLAKGTKEQVLETVMRSAKAKKNWATVQLLIIDEASMMSKALFEKLDYVARHLRSHLPGGMGRKPFGGVVLCLCGDFFQLPPVSRGVAGDEARFCFESDVWAQCIKSPLGANAQNCYALTEIFRQKDARLLDLLSEVRFGRVTDKSLHLVHMLSRELPPIEGVEPTKLFGVNSRANAVNEERLAALDGGEHGPVNYEAEDTVPQTLFLAPDKVDELTMYPRVFSLKVGAQVMLLRNATLKLVNGSRGVVQSFTPGPDDEPIPVVKFMNGETFPVHRHKYEREMGGGRVFTRSQIPLKLSWAITIHKSQGMTIDYLEVDLRNIFEAGQAYVALSRARTLEGLRVVGFDARRVWTNPKVIEFYSSCVKQL